MSLSGYRVSAQIAVSDMARTVEFYEGKLGLSPVEQPGVGRVYACGDGTERSSTASGRRDQHEGPSESTLSA
jgi:catechol 2,3-dioxygenase-like lactoylglutathione lyase family enzyme